MPLDNVGPVSQALLGKNTGAATPVSSALTPTTVPQTVNPPVAASPNASGAGAQQLIPQPPSDTSNQVQPDTLTGLASSLRQAVADLQTAESEPSPNPPPTPYLPPPPAAKPYDPIHAWGSTAMILASLGSMLTRRPLITALNAGGQVMTAYKQQNQAMNTSAFNTWKAQTANALQLEKYQMDQYNKILNDKNQSIKDKIAAVQAYAGAIKDGPTIAALETGGLPAVIDLQKKRGSASAQLADTSFDVDTANTASQSSDTPDQSGFSKNQWLSIAQAVLGGDASAKPEFASGKLGDIQKEEYDKAILQVRAQLPPGTASGGSLSAASLAALGKSWALGAPMSQLTAGLGSSASDVRAEITNYGINWLQSQGRDPTSFLVNQSNYKANQELLDNMNKLAGNASAYEETTINNMNTAESLMGAGIPTNISPLLNQIAAYGEVQSGSPATLKFGAALATVFADYSKVMSGGTGSAAASSDSARQEAANLLPKFGTQAQTEAVFDVMRRDMRGKMNEYGNSLNAIDQAIQQGKIAADVGIEAPPAPYTPAPSSNGGGSIPAAGSTLHYDAQGNLVQ